MMALTRTGDKGQNERREWMRMRKRGGIEESNES